MAVPYIHLLPSVEKFEEDHAKFNESTV